MDNKVIKDGVLELTNDVSIDCYVLEDGTRVLSSLAMAQALGMVDEGDPNPSGTRLARYLGQKTLEPYLYKGKEYGHFDPIVCYKGEKKINGYEATVLVDICDAFLQARREINLSARQKIVAAQCEVLIRSFAKVGIIALVDEATGYQYEREDKELQLILKALIGDEKTKWEKMFPLSFYKEIYKIWNIPFTPKNIRNKPSFIGTITNKYVYLNLPGGPAVLKELKRRTPKSEKGNYKHKLHQWLTDVVGKETLKKVITTVESFASISDSKKDFDRYIEKKYGVSKDQIQLIFPEMDEEINIASKQNASLPPLSDFNKNLQTGLNWSPKKEKPE